MRLPDETELLCELVEIPSVNPGPRPPKSPEEGEGQIADFIRSFWEQARVDCELQEVLPGRPNVIAQLTVPGTQPLLLETHTDTVPPDPESPSQVKPQVRDTRVYGRGACDAKASLAAMMLAVARAAASGRIARSVIMAACVDEEYLFRGATALVERGLEATEAVVGEPTSLEVVSSHKGAMRWRLVTRGRAAHASTPELGENAIYKMAAVVHAIEQYAEVLDKEPKDPVIGGPTICVGVISGGKLPNVVADYCEILLDRRLMPGERGQRAEAELRSFLARRLGSGFTYELTTLLDDPPLEAGANDVLARKTAEVVKRVLGEASVTAVRYGSDASKFAQAGIPSIVLGPGDIRQAHSSDEWVEIEQVRLASRIYEALVTTS
ncbi:MAG: M20 family metallopeptidase [Armatimonadetes bacterium]|nr:M20 family metallopeptidase [Armatimonadota bacterium]